MSEQYPSQLLHGERIVSQERAVAEAYAAKPFMDIACDIYDAHVDMATQEGEIDADVRNDILKQDTGINMLAELAQRESDKAGEQFEVTGSVDYKPELTEGESLFVEGMQVVAHREKAVANANKDSILDRPDQEELLVHKMLDDLGSLEGAASQAKNREEASKYRQLNRRIEAYSFDRVGYNDQFGDSTVAAIDTVEYMCVNPTVTPRQKADYRLALKLLGEDADMHNFIAQYTNSVEGGETTSESENTKPVESLKAENAEQAAEIVEHSPDIMRSLVDEAEAFADFAQTFHRETGKSADELKDFDALAERAKGTLLPSLRKAIEDWAKDGAKTQSATLSEYISAREDDPGISLDELDAMQSARSALKNQFFTSRKSSLIKRAYKADFEESTEVQRRFAAQYSPKP